MCGIYGVVNWDGPVERDAVARSIDRLVHRGPDDSGVWIDATRKVALAHRRLAVIDLTPSGHQPMRSRNGRQTIVFNGEIYNFASLRAELRESGAVFTGSSDTEVLLAAYRHWGPHCLSRLHGMFAFAIHEAETESTPATLFLARDRVGKKPLYYADEPHAFQFASELKAITGPRSIDPIALESYLALGYVPASQCLSTGVRKLEPGHAAQLDLSTRRLRTWRYWSLPASAPVPQRVDRSTLVDEAEALLRRAVTERLTADVPVGVLLSGGLDSSLIVASAATSGATLNTFTATLAGSPLDEAARARTIAEHFGTRHHEVPLERASLRTLESLAPFIDEPIGDSSILPSFELAKLTRQHVTVALGGDGGDELFGGYDDYRSVLLDAAALQFVPAPVLAGAAGLAALLPAGVKGRNRIASLRGGPARRLVWQSTYFDRTLRGRLLEPTAAGRSTTTPEQWLDTLFAEGSGTVESMTRQHFHSQLPDCYLVKIDRASMANSLEVRSPLMDHRLAELCFGRLPDDARVTTTHTRVLQRDLAARLLPPTADFTRKQGFSIPMDTWLRESRCAPVRDHLDALPGCIRRSAVSSLIDGEMKGRANGARLFSLAMLAIASRNNGWS